MLFPFLRTVLRNKLFLSFGLVAVIAAMFEAIPARAAQAVFPVEQSEQEHTYARPRTLSSWQIADGTTRIYLWGIEPIDNADAVFKLSARTALSEKIGDGAVKCILKSEQREYVLAQCVNSKEEDLSLFMLEEGYVTALRSAIYGTIFEKPYLAAEEKARTEGAGVWRAEKNAKESGGIVPEKFFLVAILFLALGVLGLGFISFHIMRGFGRVVDVQNKTMDLAVKERHLKDKERFIIASMLDSEVRENKNKIEAYLVVYEEVLRDLSDKTRTPKYKQSGDIIQKQPALGRSVFDGNTDRLDLMGQYLASDIIHYYARIKTIPDYVDITPDTPLEEALKLVQTAVEHAQKLDEISRALTKNFISSGLVKREG